MPFWVSKKITVVNISLIFIVAFNLNGILLLKVPVHARYYHLKEAGFTLYLARAKQSMSLQISKPNCFATSNKFQLEFQAKILLCSYAGEKQSPLTAAKHEAGV